MRWIVLCVFFVSLHKGISASLADQMAEMTQQCCEQGTAHARSHGGTECPTSVPPNVPPMFTTVCTYAMEQCCKEQYKKTEACDLGIDIATKKQDCRFSKDPSRICCDECLKGSAAGIARGGSACVTDTRGQSGDQLMAGNAFNTCCQKSASQSRTETATRPGDAIVTRKPLEDELTSVCDMFAPNELCAHHCIPIPGSYKCECNPGFRLMADKKNCIEVEKNRCKPHNPCQHKCNDNGIQVLCSCRRGYQLMADGKSCEDIDECLLNPPVCLSNTQCVNIQGSYKCILKKINSIEKGQCPPGFSRNIINNACDDINECKLPQPPCPSYLCENTVGAYKCGGIKGDPENLPKKHAEDRCPPGFKSNGSDNCEDIDECAVHKHDCNLMSQFCINTRGSFYCQDKVSKHCPPGFKIDHVTNKCEDINECEEDEGICKPNQICVNLPGEYNCKAATEISSNGINPKCADGLRYSTEYRGCVDIDECAEGIHICDQYQSCHNTYGGHTCNCKLGFELDTTTGACVDINECATDQNDCIAQSQRCDNTVGSYLCVRFISCGTGYILHHSSSKCEDIDECALGTHNCARAGPEYRCHNIPGSFRCVRGTTTTTSTPAPEYEYEYYDSEEEIDDGNKNNTKPSSDKPKSEQTSTTTQKPTTSATKPTTTKPPEIQTLQPDININEPAEIDHTQEDLNNNIYTIDNDKSDKSKPSQPEIPKDIPTSSESMYRIEYTTEPSKKPETFTPEPTEPHKSTVTEDEISYIPIDERPAGPKRTDSTEPPGPKYNVDPINKTPVEVPQGKLDPKENEIDTYDTVTQSVTLPTSPKVVMVEVGKETATVRGEQTPGGSIIVDSKTIPTNEWTKINVKPINCQFGFERDSYGACYDIDECSTNRHICSGLTEVCRNTMGGYVCDCAVGFRRDLASGTCVYIDWSTSSTTSTTTTTTTRPPPPPPPPPTLPPMPPVTPPTPPPTLPTTTLTTTAPPTTTPPTTAPPTTSPPTTIPPTTLPPTTPPPTTPPPTTPPPTTPLPTPPPTQPSPPTTERIFWGYPVYRPFPTRPFKPRNICEMGYLFNTNTGACEDINECTNGQANCAAVEICVNTKGGYRCECPPNWELDSRRQRCVPVRNNQQFPQGYGNEPSYNSNGIHYSTKSRPSKPKDVVEDRVNKCPAGYELGYDNSCQDIDECMTGEAKCGFMQLCTNLPGGYTCSCPAGYTLVGDHECEDVDECAAAGSIPVCSQNADCINTLGSFQCRCHPGFRPAPRNDKVCMDVNECEENRAGSLCQQGCVNVWGGYRCSCHRGYRLSHDNSSCSDVDECVEYKTRHLCDGRCLNEPGSYRCTCPKGYRLSEDKRSCIDIDECESGEAPCAHSSPYAVTSDICVNMRGGYHCHRIVCPPGYKMESRHRCTKIDAICAPSDRNCTHQPSTISYNFFTFVSKLYIPDPSVDLFSMKGPVWPTARMRFELKLVEVNAPPTVKERADINSFMLLQRGNNQGVITLVKSLDGPQSIELELSMHLYNRGQFAGIAVAKLYIYVSEYEF